MKENQIRLLEALARFKYLNTEQMLCLGITSKKQNLYSNVINELRDIPKPYVLRQRMPRNQVFGMRDLYHLSKKGALWLEDEQIMEKEEIRYPIGYRPVTTRDYHHRVATINIHIGLSSWLKAIDEKTVLVSSYFDRPGSQRNGSPRILNKIEISDFKYLLPDLITYFSYKGDSKIIIWEQHNGKDTKKLLRQVETHIEALKRGLVGKKIGVDRLHRIGWVFEHESIMQASIKRLCELYGTENNLYKFFIFKHDEEITEDFPNNWLLWTGEKTTLIG